MPDEFFFRITGLSIYTCRRRRRRANYICRRRRRGVNGKRVAVIPGPCAWSTC